MTEGRPYADWTIEALKEYEERLYDDEVDGEDTWFVRDQVLWELNWREADANSKEVKMEIGTELDRQKLSQLEGLAIGMEQRGEKSAAHMIRLAIDDIESLRKTLYELLHVSFPPVGGDTSELTKKHYEVVRTGCNLLGINPDGVL